MKKNYLSKSSRQISLSYFLTTLRLIVVSYIALPLTFVTLVALNASDREGVASVKRRGGVVNFVHFERKYHRFLLNYFTLSCILISPHCLHGFSFSLFLFRFHPVTLNAYLAQVSFARIDLRLTWNLKPSRFRPTIFLPLRIGPTVAGEPLR